MITDLKISVLLTCCSTCCVGACLYHLVTRSISLSMDRHYAVCIMRTVLVKAATLGTLLVLMFDKFWSKEDATSR
jgi:hypothetical protein